MRALHTCQHGVQKLSSLCKKAQSIHETPRQKQTHCQPFEPRAPSARAARTAKASEDLRTTSQTQTSDLSAMATSNKDAAIVYVYQQRKLQP